jgi:hypothetical protein
MVADNGAKYLDLFIEVTKSITSSLNPDEVFKLITQKIPRILNVDAAASYHGFEGSHHSAHRITEGEA